MSTAIERARQFLEEEKQFRLQGLVTESPNPRTRQFSQTIRRDTAAGVKNLLEVDQDIPPVANRVLQSAEYRQYLASAIRAVKAGRTICYSGCGASGRVAIILEAMWRIFWERMAAQYPDWRARCLDLAERVVGIITGGDRALIRSVENFEDFQVFGRRQVQDIGIQAGDVLVGMGEDGVGSSVIGTVKEAFDRGADAYFIYDNPTEFLRATYQRSRDLIDNPAVVKFDFTTGGMALTGSTRLQATSMAMLILGTAMEETACTILAEENPAALGPMQSIAPEAIRSTYVEHFASISAQLGQGAALAGLAQFVELEQEMYSQGGLVTYIADPYLLDIFSDTTERTPTFMIPPFHQAHEKLAPEPWAFAKHPLLPTRAAWDYMLRHQPRGLEWTPEDYRGMGGRPEMIANPPALSREQIYRFQIGNEDDPGRYQNPKAALVWVCVDGLRDERVEQYFIRNLEHYSDAAVVTLGGSALRISGARSIHIPLDLPQTCCDLFKHAAVKLAFNTLSTGTMGRLGRIFGNWMIQVHPTNKKLVDRSIRIIADLTGLDYEQACIEFFQSIVEGEGMEQPLRDSYVVMTLRRLGKMPVG